MNCFEQLENITIRKMNNIYSFKMTTVKDNITYIHVSGIQDFIEQ